MITECNGKSELPSCKIYELFNEEKGNSNEFNDECNTIHGKLMYDGILDLCKKFGSNLVNVCTDREYNSSLNYNCEFLHHWLFNKIINNLGLHNNGTRNGVKRQFYDTWINMVKKIGCSKKCDPNTELFRSSTIDALIFRKDMYDYTYNYDNFDKIISHGENTCNKLSIYLTSMQQKYDLFKDSCPKIDNKCFHDNKSLEEYSTEKLCRRFGCKSEELCSKYFDEEPTQSIPGEGVSPEEAKESGDVGGETVASVDESETSTILTTLTPIRSWLNNRILQRKNIEEYMDDEANNEIQDNYFLHENREPGKSGYGIAYHSVENISDYNM
ncbi:PIR Superfamily Protein [Plasmodium ovale wallikeri]|uniref:PIR Superfamily Protein n=1 Tax=Plasmodium ovale wallikeri TaxID=864142 RepID=A0A1A9AL56_PLAOA|nr:PIR Superfamily Protein [Plasmodium ovale wallikeri]SBT56927.1 PIR Superfamily Protein [Plasmodium ovale wallikeri]